MKKENQNILNEPSEGYFANLSEEGKLKQDVFRPDMEKFLLFTKMLRTNNVLKKAKITHK